MSCDNCTNYCAMRKALRIRWAEMSLCGLQGGWDACMMRVSELSVPGWAEQRGSTTALKLQRGLRCRWLWRLSLRWRLSGPCIWDVQHGVVLYSTLFTLVRRLAVCRWVSTATIVAQHVVCLPPSSFPPQSFPWTLGTSRRSDRPCTHYMESFSFSLRGLHSAVCADARWAVGFPGFGAELVGPWDDGATAISKALTLSLMNSFILWKVGYSFWDSIEVSHTFPGRLVHLASHHMSEDAIPKIGHAEWAERCFGSFYICDQHFQCSGGLGDVWDRVVDFCSSVGILRLWGWEFTQSPL